LLQKIVVVVLLMWWQNIS